MSSQQTRWMMDLGHVPMPKSWSAQREIRIEEEAAIRADAEVKAAEERGRIAAEQEQRRIAEASARVRQQKEAETKRAITGFGQWWAFVGHKITQSDGEDEASFACRVARAAWDYAESLKQDSVA